MLFFFFFAALAGSTGWMLCWALAGMFFSSRPSHLFFLPLACAAFGEPVLGVWIVVLTWVYLIFKQPATLEFTNNDPHPLEMEDVSLMPSPAILHQPAKPGA